jgi:hypothetical protein
MVGQKEREREREKERERREKAKMLFVIFVNMPQKMGRVNIKG